MCWSKTRHRKLSEIKDNIYQNTIPDYHLQGQNWNNDISFQLVSIEDMGPRNDSAEVILDKALTYSDFQSFICQRSGWIIPTVPADFDILWFYDIQLFYDFWILWGNLQACSPYLMIPPVYVWMTWTQVSTWDPTYPISEPGRPTAAAPLL